MSISTRNANGVITPLSGYKLVITVVGESIRVSARRKLKKEMPTVVSPIIEYKR